MPSEQLPLWPTIAFGAFFALVLGIGTFTAGLAEGGMGTLVGLAVVPPCIQGMDGTFQIPFGKLDDEGYSEGLGDLRRGGWTITNDTWAWGSGGSIEAECRKAFP